MTDYRLNEAKAAARLQELTESDDGLRRELGLCRLLIEQAIEAKQLLLAKDLMSTLATLQKAHTAHELRRGALVDAHTLEGWARQIGTAVAEELEGVYGREEICDRLAVRFAAILGAAKTEQQTRVSQ